MFTGIIDNLGKVEELARAEGGARLFLLPRLPVAGLADGESIAVDGACLTVEPGSRPDRLIFYLSGETLARTTLGGLKRGGVVNLERALRADSRLGGHLVLGHVDGVGKIKSLGRRGEGWDLEVAYPAELSPYLAEKGSVAVAGISLTLARMDEATFSVAVIPHTIEQTSLREAAAGAAVNLEADVLARYVVRALAAQEGKAGGQGKSKLSAEMLHQAGW